MSLLLTHIFALKPPVELVDALACGFGARHLRCKNLLHPVGVHHLQHPGARIVVEVPPVIQLEPLAHVNEPLLRRAVFLWYRSVEHELPHGIYFLRRELDLR